MGRKTSEGRHNFMNGDLESELPLKPYLLGDLNPDDQQLLEQRLMIDSAAFEELRWTEEELIDDYLQGALSSHDKEKFENYFLAAPERLKKLDFAKALKSYVSANRKKESLLSTLRNFWQTLWRQPNPALRWALATSLLLIVAGGSWSVMRISRLQKALAQTGTLASQQQLIEMQNRNSALNLALQHEQTRYRKLEQEAANLKRGETHGSSSLLPGQLQSIVVAVALNPGQLRDRGGIQRINIAGTDIVQIELKMEPLDYPQFQAALQFEDDSRILTQIFPKTESGTQEQSFRLLVPANELRAGDYVLKLGGLIAGGEFEEIGKYRFRIVRK
jgi:hypothetical protein